MADQQAGAGALRFTADGFTFLIDPVTLRDSCTEPERLAEFCDAHPDAPTTVAYLRMIGRLDEAEARGRAAVDTAATEPQRAAAMGRLAHVLQWQGRFSEALDLFGEALGMEAVRVRPALEAMLLQHRAKCRWEAGDPDGGREDAERALALRLETNQPEDVVESARMLVARLLSARER